MNSTNSIVTVFVAGGLAGLSCCYAHAGVLIEANIIDMRVERPLQYRTELLIEGERLKIDTTQFRPGEGRTEILYDSSQRVLYLVNHTEQSYVELDEVLLFETIDGLNAVIGFLKRKAGVAGAHQKSAFYQICKTDEIQTIAALRSRKHLIIGTGGVRQEVWVASWEEAGIDRRTFDGVRRLAEAYEKVMSNLRRVRLFREVEYVSTRGLFEIDGFPVAIRHFENGKLLYDMQFGPPVVASPSPLALLLPEGYERAWGLD